MSYAAKILAMPYLCNSFVSPCGRNKRITERRKVPLLRFLTRGEIHEDLAILPAPIQIPAADVYDQPDRNRRRVSAGDGAGAARARVLQHALRLRTGALRPDDTDRVAVCRCTGAHVLLYPAAVDEYNLRLYLRRAAAQ